MYKTDMVTASMVKYCINSFLATKVTFMNEMYDVLRNARGTDWKTFSEIISNDPRIGKTHMKVPGNDGQRGYAGSCFPKDTNALAWFAREGLNFKCARSLFKANKTLQNFDNIITAKNDCMTGVDMLLALHKLCGYDTDFISIQHEIKEILSKVHVKKNYVRTKKLEKTQKNNTLEKIIIRNPVIAKRPKYCSPSPGKGKFNSLR